MSKKIKVDFSKCPYCESKRVHALFNYPEYNHVADEYNEEHICGDCQKEWITIYKPCRNEIEPHSEGLPSAHEHHLGRDRK